MRQSYSVRWCCNNTGRLGGVAADNRMPRMEGYHEKAGKRSGGILAPLELLEGAWTPRHLDFTLLASRTVEEYVSITLNCPVYVILLRQP